MASCQSWQTYPSQWSRETLNKLIDKCKKTSDISALQDEFRTGKTESVWRRTWLRRGIRKAFLQRRGWTWDSAWWGKESTPTLLTMASQAIPFWCSNNRHVLNPREEGLLRSSGPGLRSSQRRLSAALKQQRILKSASTCRGGEISLPSTLLKIARHQCQSWTHPALLLAEVVLSNFPS